MKAFFSGKTSLRSLWYRVLHKIDNYFPIRSLVHQTYASAKVQPDSIPDLLFKFLPTPIQVVIPIFQDNRYFIKCWRCRDNRWPLLNELFTATHTVLVSRAMPFRMFFQVTHFCRNILIHHLAARRKKRTGAFGRLSSKSGLWLFIHASISCRSKYPSDMY